MGDLSEHFSSYEFDCPHCGRIHVDPELVKVLERLRDRVGRPLRIVSGFRCKTHNRRVGGARRSLHLVGSAADIPVGYATVDEALAAGARGVGYRGRWAVHIDTRRVDRPVTFRD